MKMMQSFALNAVYRSLVQKRIMKCEKNCENECSGGKHGPPYFFAAIVILFGLWIVFEFVLRKIDPMPDWLAWVNSFNFWWIFALVVAIMIIAAGIRMMTKK